jgi:hypothetical protein
MATFLAKGADIAVGSLAAKHQESGAKAVILQAV